MVEYAGRYGRIGRNRTLPGDVRTVLRDGLARRDVKGSSDRYFQATTLLTNWCRKVSSRVAYKGRRKDHSPQMGGLRRSVWG
ncbi:hypothetical protein KCP74_12615 [Salmonella enterica subsp. enterica]|nr:hypothetical protein KCP74_12615 [Salmonella enterica subsp. enterica]